MTADYIEAQMQNLLGKPLSDREHEVTQAILAGCTTKALLAARLEIAGGTVGSHLTRIFAKTGAVNLADLILMAWGRKACAIDLNTEAFVNIDNRAEALLHALNELFLADWAVTPGPEFYAYTLTLYPLDAINSGPFVYKRSIRPAHINGEPFRTALQFADEVCERYGRYILLKPENDDG